LRPSTPHHPIPPSHQEASASITKHPPRATESATGGATRWPRSGPGPGRLGSATRCRQGRYRGDGPGRREV